MSTLARRRLLIAAPLVVLLLVAVGALFLTRGQDLRSRAARISAGMPREEVEGLLGRPVLDLPRSAGRGTAVVWVDQLWQVTVYTGPDGRAESVECIPSDSFLRRTVGRVVSLPK
jgi:hypothetical protein